MAPAPVGRPMAGPDTATVEIPAGDVALEGILAVPDGARGIVVFAHGSGSSRESPRNNYVAEVIRGRRLGTLLFDLLTEEEDRVREHRFDIPLLTDRLEAATEWLWSRDETVHLPVGYFGSSTGAAAALRAATRFADQIDAIVSRGGRVDMAADVLGDVSAPTLLVVGGTDTAVLEHNRDALERLGGEAELHVVVGADHRFEGPRGAPGGHRGGGRLVRPNAGPADSHRVGIGEPIDGPVARIHTDR